MELPEIKNIVLEPDSGSEPSPAAQGGGGTVEDRMLRGLMRIAQEIGGNPKAYFDSATSGAIAGFGDEAHAAEAALLGKTPQGGWFDYSKSMGERYDDMLAAKRAEEAKFKQESPVGSAAAEIGGAVASPLAKIAAPFRASTTAGRIAQAGGTSAAYGGLHGFGTGEGGFEQRAENATKSAIWSGLVGLGFGSIATRWARRTEDIPTINDLRERAKALYDQIDNSGVLIRNSSIERMLKQFEAKPLGQSGQIQPGSFTDQVLRDIRSKIGGDGVSYGALTSYRSWIIDAIGKAQASKADKDAAAATTLKNMFDDFVQNLRPNQIRIGSQAGAAAAGDTTASFVAGGPRAEAAGQYAKILKQAGDLWRRKSNAEDLENLVEIAGLTAQQYANGGIENAIRAQFRQLAVRIAKGQETGFNKAEIAAINRVAQGDKLTNTMRYFGKFAPTGTVPLLAGLGGGYGVPHAASLMGLPIPEAVKGAIAIGFPAAATAAKAAATARAQQNLTQAIETARKGSELTNAKVFTPQQADLVRRLAVGTPPAVDALDDVTDEPQPISILTPPLGR